MPITVLVTGYTLIGEGEIEKEEKEAKEEGEEEKEKLFLGNLVLDGNLDI
jgi:hypothetical protein